MSAKKKTAKKAATKKTKKGARTAATSRRAPATSRPTPAARICKSCGMDTVYEDRCRACGGELE